MTRRDRRPLRTVAVLAVLTLVTSGCFSLPDDVDGTLTDGWSPMAEPVQFAPVAGICHGDEATVGRRLDYFPIDCNRSHRVETIHVGTYPAAQTDGVDVPVPDSPEGKAVWAECEQRATEFLGDLWQAGRLRLIVVSPSPQAWAGGARWFRCDLGETVGVFDVTLRFRSVSLRGVLTGDDPIRLGCFDSPSVTDEQTWFSEPLPCDTTHQSEFAGTYVEDKLSLTQLSSDNPDAAHDRCRQVVASYAKLPVDGNLEYRFGTIYAYPSADEWAAGDRRIRCFVWRTDPPLNRSVRGGGTSALPIQYG